MTVLELVNNIFFNNIPTSIAYSADKITVCPEIRFPVEWFEFVCKFFSNATGCYCFKIVYDFLRIIEKDFLCL